MNEKDKNFRVVFSRYPATKLDLFNINELKPAILIRKPIDQIVSLYTKHIKKIELDEIKQKNLNIEFLEECVNRYKIFSELLAYVRK